MSEEILVPVSPGEVIDKMTILRIKRARITDPVKVANVQTELALLEQTWRESRYAHADIAQDTAALQSVNERLWVIEDEIRDEERAQRFGERFIELARSVYIVNDERAQIKKRINLALGSALIEEKSYAAYR
jgi:Family of unknown function (DUF6165)